MLDLQGMAAEGVWAWVVDPGHPADSNPDWVDEGGGWWRHTSNIPPLTYVQSNRIRVSIWEDRGNFGVSEDNWQVSIGYIPQDQVFATTNGMDTDCRSTLRPTDPPVAGNIQFNIVDKAILAGTDHVYGKIGFKRIS